MQTPSAPHVPFDILETAEFVRKEDSIRAKRASLCLPIQGRVTWTNIGGPLFLMRQYLPGIPRIRINRSEGEALVAKLAAGAALVPDRTHTLASACTMRMIRQRVIQRLLQAFERYSDEELRTFTIINTKWVFNAHELKAINAKIIKNQLRTHLNRAGITRLPGPFIAFLHGEFDPVSGLFTLHFHGLTTREKAKALDSLTYKEVSKPVRPIRCRDKQRSLKQRSWGYENTRTRARPIVRKRITDRPRQFSYLLKSYWPSRGIRMIGRKRKRDRRGQRIREPFHTQVLLWLDKQRLRDLTLLHDCWSPRNGGPAEMRELYLSIVDDRY
jgi:hypothetical protein